MRCDLQTVAILDAGHQLPYAIKSVNVDLPELQGEMEDIAKEKCRIAASKVACGAYYSCGVTVLQGADRVTV